MSGVPLSEIPELSMDPHWRSVKRGMKATSLAQNTDLKWKILVPATEDF